MQNQYRHLIYLREMETVYYRCKCEQFLKNIDVIVNAKMSAKGNQMIYELDVTNRELRTLKDHYYLMERYMREEIRKEFQKEISCKNNLIHKLKDDFGNYQDKMKNELQEKCFEEISNAEEMTFKQLREGNKSLSSMIRRSKGPSANDSKDCAEAYAIIQKLQ